MRQPLSAGVSGFDDDEIACAVLHSLCSIFKAWSLELYNSTDQVADPRRNGRGRTEKSVASGRLLCC